MLQKYPVLLCFMASTSTIGAGGIDLPSIHSQDTRNVDSKSTMIKNRLLRFACQAAPSCSVGVSMWCVSKVMKKIGFEKMDGGARAIIFAILHVHYAGQAAEKNIESVRGKLASGIVSLISLYAGVLLV